MKKLLATALVAAMLCSFAAGCASTNPPADTTATTKEAGKDAPATTVFSFVSQPQLKIKTFLPNCFLYA